MPTATRPRRPHPARVRRPDVFEDHRAPDGSEALLRYHEAAGEPGLPEHVVALHWPFNVDRKPLTWRYATVEEARVGWREARAYLVSLGFERLVD
jgi:hypothetical protein